MTDDAPSCADCYRVDYYPKGIPRLPVDDHLLTCDIRRRELDEMQSYDQPSPCGVVTDDEFCADCYRSVDDHLATCVARRRSTSRWTNTAELALDVGRTVLACSWCGESSCERRAMHDRLVRLTSEQDGK